MKSTSKHRTLKKVFLNVTACLTALVVTGSIIANECEVQLNRSEEASCRERV